MRGPMRPPITGSLLVATLVACGGGTAPAADRVAEANVTARFQGWVKAWNIHNADSLAPFYIQKEYLSVAWPTGARTHGWAEESRLQHTFMPTVTVTNLVPQTPRIVLVRKDLALISFPFTLDLAAAGSRQIERKGERDQGDRKSTRLNSSHLGISYAVFCLKKKKK